MPEEKGLYWARVGTTWYLVDWQDIRAIAGNLFTMHAWLRDEYKGHMVAGKIDPTKVDEWAARVVEPGEI